MTEEERKDYLKYIENYTINDLADIFNTQNFVIQDKDKFNEILLYYHFKQNEEIEQLQQENQELKKQLEEANEKILLLQASEPMLKYKKTLEENQQKEFIEYMNKTIEELECDDTDDEEIKGYLIQRIDTFKEILSKYKEIIGDDKQWEQTTMQ